MSPSASLDDLPARADVVVVGGGLGGVSAAYHLARAGVGVALLERDRVGAGATEAAVGLLEPALRQPFSETVRFHGAGAATAAWRFARGSAAALADLLEEAGHADEVALDRAGATVLAQAGTLAEVEADFRALADAGLGATWLDDDAVGDRTGTDAFVGGYHLDGPAALDGGGAARVLAGLARKAGASVLEGVGVEAVEAGDGALTVRAGRHEVACEMVVYATHVESRRFSQFLGDEIVPIRGQALVTEPLAPRHAGAFATHWKMNAWRQDPAGRLWLGGWRWDAWDRSYWKLRPEVDDALQAELQRWYEGAFPDRAPLPVARRWGGIFGWTADSLPLAGPLPGSPRELVVGGFSGGGLAFAFGCGRVVAAVVTGAEAPEGGALFNPRRFV